VTAAPSIAGIDAGVRGADDGRLAEWRVRPPGRLGRLLIAEVERYLEFFAIARTPATP
jgi:hypothetical protein